MKTNEKAVETKKAIVKSESKIVKAESNKLVKATPAVGFTMTPSLRTKIDELVRKTIGPKVAVEAKLDRRYTNRPAIKGVQAGWGAYERFLLSDKKVVFVNLRDPQAPVVTVSEKTALAKTIAQVARKAKRAEELAAKKATAPKQVTMPSAKAPVKKVKVVKVPLTLLKDTKVPQAVTVATAN